jgi:hypothetical protein
MTSIRADSTDIRADSIGLTLIVVILLMLASLMAGIGLKEYVGACPHHPLLACNCAFQCVLAHTPAAPPKEGGRYDVDALGPVLTFVRVAALVATAVFVVAFTSALLALRRDAFCRT